MESSLWASYVVVTNFENRLIKFLAKSNMNLQGRQSIQERMGKGLKHILIARFVSSLLTAN